MSLIEQAARRLEELRRAGVEVAQETVGNVGGSRTPRVQAQTIKERSSVSAAQFVDADKKEQGEQAQSRRIDLDLETLLRLGFITPDAPRSRIADEFRVIKRPLIANAAGKGATPVKNGNLIMVTSSVPGEGKSFTAVNLALSLAMETDKSVLLVDADVARPALPRMLGLPSLPGLLDVLQDKTLELNQVLLRTNVEKLSILTSGSPCASATELLASDGMARLLAEMANRYSDRLIVFDSPPLLVTTESRVLATLMGQIVFVVRSEETRQNQVEQALATIEACPVKMLLLNQAETVAQGAYGYGYGYGYGT